MWFSSDIFSCEMEKKILRLPKVPNMFLENEFSLFSATKIYFSRTRAENYPHQKLKTTKNTDMEQGKGRPSPPQKPFSFSKKTAPFFFFFKSSAQFVLFGRQSSDYLLGVDCM